jgi:glycosyltransferase involved in cell wall biosynthesis
VSAAGPSRPPVAVHQFIPTLNPRDATGSHTLLLRDILRAAGWRSEIFAEAIHDDLATEAYKHWTYPEHAAAGDVAIYQFSTSSVVARFLAERSEPLIVDFHNFTAPEHFRGWEPHSEERAARAHDDLVLLAHRAELGMADSRFNEGDLRRAGYQRTTVIPVLVDYRRVGASAPPDRRVAAELAAVQARARGGADFLFVGRIVPSKAQHLLVAALWAYRRLYDPAARLHLVGGSSSFAYLKALRAYIAELGLVDAVRITGDVSDAALAAYFGAADAYVSLSSHEGFGVPLVEAMAAGIPIVARRAGAVAETAGDAALLLDSTDPAYVAAALHRVVSDVVLARLLVEAGRRRLPAFAPDAVAPQLVAAVASVAGPPAASVGGAPAASVGGAPQ